MADLSPSTQQLLVTFRAAEVTPAHAQARVWSRLSRTIAAGGALAAAGAATATGWAAKGVASSTVAIVSKWIALGVVLTATGSVAVRQLVHSPQTRSAATVVQPVGTARNASRAARPVPARAALPAPPAAVPSQAPQQPKRSPSAHASSILEETRLLEQAQRSLSAGDPSQALAWLDQYHARHTGGALDEEAQATRVLALCAQGRSAEGQALAERFASDHPDSPLLRRVLGACPAR